jgi:hypothetical protein
VQCSAAAEQDHNAPTAVQQHTRKSLAVG